MPLFGIGSALGLPPVLVTPRLPNATMGVPYGASLMIGASPALSSASLAGLPAGLTATHNGGGNLAISGTPTVSGAFTLGVSATNADGTISPSVALQVDRWADDVQMVAAGEDHSCALVGGGVQCWGANFEGQLGNNGTKSDLLWRNDVTGLVYMMLMSGFSIASEATVYVEPDTAWKILGPWEYGQAAGIL